MQSDVFKDKPDGKKNVITFIIGSICWILLASFLFSPHYDHSSFLLLSLKDFFPWFVLIDISSVAVIYKMYYGKSILTELVPETKEKEKEN